MFIDRHHNDYFKSVVSSYQKEVQRRFTSVKSYMDEQFHEDIELLIMYFEGQTPIDFDILRNVEGRLVHNLFRLMSCEELIDHPLFQLLMSCKMGFSKLGGVISFKEICSIENITRQQLHIQTYDLLANPPEEERRNKLPAIKLHGNSFCFLRDFHYWQATRTRRKK